MKTSNETAHVSVEPLPPTLLSRNPLAWLTVFGPGAIIASLTIGTGELIFSTRGGALFGYRILFLFVIISILKWGLVIASARHMVLTGVHPYQRMLDLPGPRGWFLVLLFLLAAVCMPIWVSFHCGVLGNFTAWVTGTKGALNGGIDYLWGAAILAGILVLTATGGYSALERVQMAIVTALVFCAGVTLFLYKPDWLELLKGAVIPQSYVYPDWLSRKYPRIAEQPVWVETTRYVGVIGGAAYDYLAYTSWLRDKRWGRAGLEPASAAEIDEIAADPTHPVRRWIRAPLIDCTLSFIVVVAFSAVFVASGAMILGPAQRVPDEANMLNLQAEFVTGIHPWLLPLYVTGAFLTMLGTLYGTLEIAYAILGEMARIVDRDRAERQARRLKMITVTWCAIGAYGVLIWTFLYQSSGGEEKPRVLMAILTPANLFTGVLFCGLFCLLLPWMDRRWLPKPLRMPGWLLLLNLVSGVIFLVLGLKGYWDHQSRWPAISGLLGALVVSVIVAAIVERSQRRIAN